MVNVRVAAPCRVNYAWFCSDYDTNYEIFIPQTILPFLYASFLIKYCILLTWNIPLTLLIVSLWASHDMYRLFTHSHWQQYTTPIDLRQVTPLRSKLMHSLINYLFLRLHCILSCQMWGNKIWPKSWFNFLLRGTVWWIYAHVSWEF